MPLSATLINTFDTNSCRRLTTIQNVCQVSSVTVCFNPGIKLTQSRNSGMGLQKRAGIAFSTFDEFMLSPSYIRSSFSQLVYQFIYIPGTVICTHIILMFYSCFTKRLKRALNRRVCKQRGSSLVQLLLLPPTWCGKIK